MEGILPFQLPFGRLVRLKDPRKNVSWWVLFATDPRCTHMVTRKLPEGHCDTQRRKMLISVFLPMQTTKT